MRGDRAGLSSDDVAKANENFERRRSELNRRMMQLPMAERREHWKYYLVQLAELDKDASPTIGEPDARRRPLQKEAPAPPLETQDAEEDVVMHPDEPSQCLAERSGSGDKKRDKTQTQVGRKRLDRASVHSS